MTKIYQENFKLLLILPNGMQSELQTLKQSNMEKVFKYIGSKHNTQQIKKHIPQQPQIYFQKVEVALNQSFQSILKNFKIKEGQPLKLRIVKGQKVQQDQFELQKQELVKTYKTNSTKASQLKDTKRQNQQQTVKKPVNHQQPKIIDKNNVRNKIEEQQNEQSYKQSSQLYEDKNNKSQPKFQQPKLIAEKKLKDSKKQEIIKIQDKNYIKGSEEKQIKDIKKQEIKKGQESKKITKSNSNKKKNNDQNKQIISKSNKLQANMIQNDLKKETKLIAYEMVIQYQNNIYTQKLEESDTIHSAIQKFFQKKEAEMPEVIVNLLENKNVVLNQKILNKSIKEVRRLQQSYFQISEDQANCKIKLHLAQKFYGGFVLAIK